MRPLALTLLPLALLCGNEYHVAQSSGNDRHPGTARQPFASLAAATARADAGDTVYIHPGLYRETLSPQRGGTAAKPLVFRSVAGPETVRISGSEPWTGRWRSTARQQAFSPFPSDFSTTRNPFLITLAIGPTVSDRPARPISDERRTLPLTLGQVFVAEQRYTQVTSEQALNADPGTWMVDRAGTGLRLHFRSGHDATQPIEVSLRAAAMRPAQRHLAHIHLIGLGFERAANQGPFPQQGMVTLRSGRDWLIAGCIIREAGTIGLDCGSETWIPDDLPADQPTIGGSNGHRILGNRIQDCGLAGIAGWLHLGSEIAGNLISGNHSRALARDEQIVWEEWAGIKLHASNTHIHDNLIVNNQAHGIWLDAGYAGVLIERNLILDNAMSGIFFELGFGPATVRHNLLLGSRSWSDFYAGDGLYAHDASGLTLHDNLIAGVKGIPVRMRLATNRLFQKTRRAACSDQLVHDNLIGLDQAQQLAIDWPAEGPRSHNKRAHDNPIFANTHLSQQIDTLPDGRQRLILTLSKTLAKRLPSTLRPSQSSGSGRHIRLVYPAFPLPLTELLEPGS